MVNFSAEQVRQIMDRPQHVRNMSVITHVDHGKSTLSDSLVAKAGIIANIAAGETRYTDDLERAKKTEELPLSPLASPCTTNTTWDTGNSDGYFINFIGSPGHVDSSSIVTAAFVVLSYVEDVEMFQNFINIVGLVNVIILLIYPSKGNIAFGSGKGF